MKQFIFAVSLLMSLVFQSLAQVQGPAFRSNNGTGTNSTFRGPVSVANYLNATNALQTNTIAGYIQQGGTARASYSAAFGLLTDASATATFVTGIRNQAFSPASLVGGTSNTVFSGANNSLLGGAFNTASGQSIFVVGTDNDVQGNNSAAIGSGMVFDANAHNSIGIGTRISFLTSPSNSIAISAGTNGVSVSRSNSIIFNSIGGTYISGSPIFGDGSGLTNIGGSSFPDAITNYDTRALVLTNANTFKATNVWDKSNVKFWGAVGDGVADDTPAFNLTLSNSISVYIPDGTYNINRVIIKTSNTRMFGSAAAVLVSTNVYPVLITGSISNLTLSGFSVIGANTNLPSVVPQSGIVFDYLGTVSGATLDNIFITECADDGVLVQSGATVTALRINNCRIINSGQGMSLSSCDDVIVNGCTFDNIQHPTDPSHAVYLNNSRHVTVIGCTARNITNANASAFTCAGSHSLVFNNNAVTNCGAIIAIATSQDVVCNGNAGDGTWNSGGAMFVYNLSTNITFSGNVIRSSVSNQSPGIAVFPGTFRTVKGVSITGNRILGFSGFGVYVSQCDDVLISDNVVDPLRFDAGQMGMYVNNGGNFTISGNQVTAGERGIYVATATNVLVAANHCFTKYTGTSSRGIYINACVRATLSANKVENGIAGSWSFPYYSDAGSSAAALIVDQNKVGIGTDTPGSKLDVAGDIRASATITSTNGFVGYATNFIANAIFTSGFTNSTAFGCGTNAMVVNVGANSGTLEFYNRSGLNGQTICGIGCFTNILTATPVDYSVGVNQGFIIRSPVGTVIVARTFP